MTYYLFRKHLSLSMVWYKTKNLLRPVKSFLASWLVILIVAPLLLSNKERLMVMLTDSHAFDNSSNVHLLPPSDSFSHSYFPQARKCLLSSLLISFKTMSIVSEAMCAHGSWASSDLIGSMFFFLASSNAQKNKSLLVFACLFFSSFVHPAISIGRRSFRLLSSPRSFFFVVLCCHINNSLQQST